MRHTPADHVTPGECHDHIGRRDRANEGAIVRLVCESADIPSAMIGRIALERPADRGPGGVGLESVKNDLIYRQHDLRVARDRCSAIRILIIQ